MKPLDQREEIQAYYRDPTVVDAYIERRTAQPFNGFLHASQVAFLNESLRERRPSRVLEIAPGPARLTAEIDRVAPIVVVDSSVAMLEAARRRVQGREGECVFLQADAFGLPFAGSSFDFVYVLKLIRHFRSHDRQRLYEEIRRVLMPGGAMVVDAQNRSVSLPHRERKGADRYRIYDVLYDATELENEIIEAGFGVCRVTGILWHSALQRRLNQLRRVGMNGMARRLIRMADRLPGGAPSTWMVLAEKRP